MYAKEDLTPVNEKEEMLIMALLRKCRGQKVNIRNKIGGTVESNDTTGVFILTEYKKPETKKLNIPWEFIKEEFICAAMDKNGSVYLYEREPSVASYDWYYAAQCKSVTDSLKIDTTDIYWKESLTFRPGA